MSTKMCWTQRRLEIILRKALVMTWFRCLSYMKGIK